MGIAIFLSGVNQRDKAKGCSRSGAGKGLTTEQVGCKTLCLLKSFSSRPTFLGILSSASAQVSDWVRVGIETMPRGAFGVGLERSCQPCC